MFAQFGDIQFENLYSPTSLDGNENADWVQHDLINSKSVMQHMGDSLKNLNLSISLRQDFCNVKDEFEKFRKYRTDGTPNQLIMGDGTVMGKFIIKEMQTGFQQLEPITGALIQLDLQLSLVEFFVRDPLKQQQAQAKKDSVSKKKLIKKSGRSNPVPCNTAIAKLIQFIKNNLAKIRAYAQGQDTNTNRALGYINVALGDARSILAGTKSPNYPCVYGNSNIAVAATALVQALQDLSETIQKRLYYPITSLLDVSIKYNTCVVPARNLEAACSNNIKSSITRGN